MIDKIKHFLYIKRHFFNRYRFIVLFFSYVAINQFIILDFYIHIIFLVVSIYFIKYLRDK